MDRPKLLLSRFPEQVAFDAISILCFGCDTSLGFSLWLSHGNILQTQDKRLDSLHSMHPATTAPITI